MQSFVAGIVDPYGGLRVVVTQRRKDFRRHLRPDELLLVVPGFKTEEPVRLEQIPWMIDRVERYVQWWISTRNDPDTLAQDAVVFYKLRQLCAYQRGSLNLLDIVET